MTYGGFSVEDFVLDKDFRQWVLFPDAHSNLFWHTWLKKNPEKRPVIEQARTIVVNMPQTDYGWNNELENSIWHSIANNTQATRNDSSELEDERSKGKVVFLHSMGVPTKAGTRDHNDWYKLVRIAACILLIMTFSIPAYFSLRENKREPLAMIHTVEAGRGKKENVVLPDGSRLTLNSGSSARFPDRFNEYERLVEIRGEAFIDVAKDSLSPFRVKTGAVITEALGTAFNVTFEKDVLEISLVEGKVKVSVLNKGRKEDELILAPGQQASLHNQNRLRKNAFNVEKVTAWKDGVIFFERAAQKEIIQTLERWYGVEITVLGQTAKHWSFTGKFKQKNLEYVLKSLSYTIDFRYEIENDRVKIIYT